MKVAVLGYGTVGFGVYEMLKKTEGLEAGPVLVRAGKEDEAFKVSSIEAIVQDASVKAVAEVMGGVEPAFTYACAALKAGKHFVTSNKALVAAKGTELAKLAEENHAAFLFSAACGGGVPFLHNMALSVDSDEIFSVGVFSTARQTLCWTICRAAISAMRMRWPTHKDSVMQKLIRLRMLPDSML